MDSLKSIFFDCGQGDMTLLKFPTGKTMLIDVCLSGNDDINIEKIKNNLLKDNDNFILDYLVITHPHNDHIKNIKLIPDNGIIIKNIWESGHRLYITKEDREENDYRDYDDMLSIINNLKRKDESKYKDLEASATPIIDNTEFGSNTKIYIFAPSGNISDEKKTKEEQEKLIHRHCAVIKIQYRDNSILFTGDSSYEEWRDSILINYKDLLSTTILHISHHGSLTFFTDNAELSESGIDLQNLEYILPSACVVSVGKNNFGHPNHQAMEFYQNTILCSDCIYITKEHGTMIAELMSNNEWIIKPDKFIRETTTEEFTIKINLISPRPYNEPLKKNIDLKFSLDITGHKDKIKKIIWQVQNNGVGDEKDIEGIWDHFHHELFYYYFSFDKTELNSSTAYNGTHYLRCTAYDEDRNYSTDVFKVLVADYTNKN